MADQLFYPPCYTFYQIILTIFISVQVRSPVEAYSGVGFSSRGNKGCLCLSSVTNVDITDRYIYSSDIIMLHQLYNSLSFSPNFFPHLLPGLACRVTCVSLQDKFLATLRIDICPLAEPEPAPP